METLRYNYRPKAYVMALAGLLFAGFTVILGKSAAENDRGLIIDRVFALNTESATAFYLLLTTFCIAFVLVAILGLVRSFGGPREVRLDGAGLTAPRNALRAEPITIPYASIIDLELIQVRSQRFLTIHHAGGKLSLSRSLLPTAADFDRIVAELHARAAAAQERKAATISRRIVSTARSAGSSIRPSRFTSRVLSSVRSWSGTIKSCVP